MKWEQARIETLLAESSTQKQLETFLLAQMPQFEAPTDVRAWRRQRTRLRREALKSVYLRGYPKSVVDARPKLVWGEVLRPDPSYVIRKLRYEVYPNYWAPALLYEPARLKGRVPVVLNPNGHHPGGKAALYKQARCANLARRGLIALSTEFIGMGELEADRLHNNLAFLDQTGLAGVGLFYLALKKALDVLLAHRHADPRRVGCTGLSGGGWQTIVISALDERITLCAPVAGYTSVRARVGCLKDVGDLEQVPAGLTAVLDYQLMTAMLAPRPALLICNQNDECCFGTDRAKPVIYDAVMPTYRAMGAEDRFEFYSNTEPGTHNYDADNRSRFYRFINRHWGLSGPEQDVHRPAELLAEEELKVGLPPAQATTASIARDRGRRLVAALTIPRTAAQRRTLRRKLAEVIRLPEYDVRSSPSAPQHGAGNVLLDIGPWQVPVSVWLNATDEPVELVIGDGGRKWGGVAKSEPAGNRVAADILCTGENRADYCYVMLVDTTGQRLTGIVTAQVLACVRYAQRLAGKGKVALVGDGQVSSLLCLLAAALHPELIDSLTLRGNLTSLLTPSAWGQSYEAVQPMLCFGFLEVADIPQLVALLEGVRYRQPERCVGDTGPASSGARPRR